MHTRGWPTAQAASSQGAMDREKYSPRLLQSIGNPVQAEKGGAVSEDTPYQGGAKQSQQKFGQGLSVSLPDLVVGVGHTVPSSSRIKMSSTLTLQIFASLRAKATDGE